MFARTAAAFLAAGILGTGVAFSQTAPNPARQSGVSRDQLPVSKVAVVGHTTPAINYRPRHDDTKIDFAGTNLMPKAKGEATISGEKGHMKIEAEFDDLAAPGTFGREYLTFVMWAITPEGRAKNLGEIQVKDKESDAKIEVTTDLQAFALIVTAEPYFAVTQPSDAIVLENVVRKDTKGNVETTVAKYELLGRGTYLMNHDVDDMKVKPVEPGVSLDLAQARNAVELARFAGADNFAADTYDKAVSLLEKAEDAKKRDHGDNEVMMNARQAVQTAEDARILALNHRR